MVHPKHWSTSRTEDLFSQATSQGLYFAFCAVIDGVEYKTGMGTTKKDARLKAAQLALEDLLPTLQSVESGLPEASGLCPMLIDECVSAAHLRF